MDYTRVALITLGRARVSSYHSSALDRDLRLAADSPKP